MRCWTNLIGYQAAWFVAVGFAARGLAWPGDFVVERAFVEK